MKKIISIIFMSVTIIIMASFLSFAGTWKQDTNGWWWDRGDGTWPANGWEWCDGNNDGVAECYYFNSNGYCLINTTTPDGYKVDANGAWVVNGVVQTQKVQANASQPVNSIAFSQTPSDIQDQIKAWLWPWICDSVKYQLKYPKTAIFPDYKNENVDIFIKDDGTFLVGGFCEARNGYGVFQETDILASGTYVITKDNNNYYTWEFTKEFATVS